MARSAVALAHAAVALCLAWTAVADASELRWSDNLGCFERHLQRKNKNVLFPPEQRVISQEEIDAARLRDLQDVEHLEKEFWGVMTDLDNLPEMATFDDLNILRERLEDLLTKSASIGDLAEWISTASKDIRKSLIETLHNLFKDDIDALNKLEEAELFYRSLEPILYNDFFSHLRHDDGCIPPGDVLPSLLSEPVRTIFVAKEIFDLEKKELTIVWFRELIRWAREEGADVYVYEKKLQILAR